MRKTVDSAYILVSYAECSRREVALAELQKSDFGELYSLVHVWRWPSP